MRNLKAALRRRLERASRIAVLAVGSPLRGDDAAGLLAAEALSRIVHESGIAEDRARRVSRPAAPMAARRRPPQLAVFIGETAPENLTGEIRRFAPTHLVILDAADLGSPPGHAALIEPGAIAGASFSTHSLPLDVLAGYLRRLAACEVVILGIQPASCDFGARVSPAVRRAARRIAGHLAAAARR